ncbi:MAG: hypothetical protein JWN31_1332 [Frankiales bacterium]|nr:hypothetical protein [Frankiales bacterium]
MTTIDQHPAPDLEPHAPLTELELVNRQLEAISRFTRAQRAAEDATRIAGVSREVRMDAARRLAVIRRQHHALVARSHQQLVSSGERPLTVLAPSRALLAHRNAWFRDKLIGSLSEYGVGVVAAAENGADAVGIAVAEQPDLVLVEDGLEMMPADAVIRELRQFCPHALIGAQVPYSDRVGLLLDAGADAVFVRQVPPVDVAMQLWERLSAR